MAASRIAKAQTQKRRHDPHHGATRHGLKQIEISIGHPEESRLTQRLPRLGSTIETPLDSSTATNTNSKAVKLEVHADDLADMIRRISQHEETGHHPSNRTGG